MKQFVGRFVKALLRVIGLAGLIIFAMLCLWQPVIVAWGQWLTVPYTQPDRADAIIVLGGNTLDRIDDVPALYEAFGSPVYITGYDPNEYSVTSQSLPSRELLIEAGIPPDQVQFVETTSTYEDAQVIVEMASQQHWQDIIFISDEVHGRRAYCIVEKMMGDESVHLNFLGAVPHYDLDQWWQSELGLVAVSNETIKLAFYMVNYRLYPWGCWQADINLPVLMGYWLLAFMLGMLGTLAVYLGARRYQWLDHPNERSSHVKPTPKGGGLSIALTVLGLLAAWFLMTESPFPKELGMYMGAAATVAFFGWLDDRRGLDAKLRLGVQVVISLMFMLGLGATLRLEVPVLSIIKLVPVLGLLIGCFWLVGVTNAYNFMDGIDGMSATQTVISSVAWVVIFSLEAQETLMLLSGLIAAAALGFWVFNRQPAIIFMGDVGSTFVGFSLATLPLLAYEKLNNPRLLPVAVLLMASCIFDTFLTFIRRALKGENVLAAHRSHLYQRLVTCGFSHAQVTGWYRFLGIAGAICGIWYYTGDTQVLWLACGIVLAQNIMLLVATTLLERRHRVTIVPRRSTPAG